MTYVHIITYPFKIIILLLYKYNFKFIIDEYCRFYVVFIVHYYLFSYVESFSRVHYMKV